MSERSYGPAPIGSTLYWLNMNWSSLTVLQIFFGMIPIVVLVTNGAYGCFKAKRIWVGDISLTVILAQSARRGLLMAGSWIFWIVKATSAAVTGSPLENMTSSRRTKQKVNPSPVFFRVLA